MEKHENIREQVLKKLSNGDAAKYKEYAQKLPEAREGVYDKSGADSILLDLRIGLDDNCAALINLRVKEWLDAHPLFEYKGKDVPSIPDGLATQLEDEIGMNVIIKLGEYHIIQSNAGRPMEARMKLYSLVAELMYQRQLERYVGDGIESHYAGIIIKGSYLKVPHEILLAECIEYDICHERLKDEGYLEGPFYKGYLNMSKWKELLIGKLTKHASDPSDPKYAYTKRILEQRAEAEAKAKAKAERNGDRRDAQDEWKISSEGLEYQRLYRERGKLLELVDEDDGKYVQYRKKVSLGLLVLFVFINIGAIILSAASFAVFTYLIKKKRDELEEVRAKIEELAARRDVFVNKKAGREIY